MQKNLISLYEGESVSDTHFTSHMLHRHANAFCEVVAREPCDLLTIDRERLSELLFKEIKESLLSRILFLKHSEFFNDVSPYALVILASKMQLRTYNYGDIIVKQGVPPTECFILVEGECKAVFGDVMLRRRAISKYAKKCLQ